MKQEDPAARSESPAFRRGEEVNPLELLALVAVLLVCFAVVVAHLNYRRH